MRIKEYLKYNRLIMDGSMGTYYSNLVNQPGSFSERANLTTPDTIKQIHKDYIAAGAELLRTNTFAASRASLKIGADEQRLLVEAACRIAKAAVAEAKASGAKAANNKDTDTKIADSVAKVDDIKDKDVWIIGDIGPIPEDANTEESEVLEEYMALCDIFLAEGLDGIHFETFSSLKYIAKLVPYIKNKNPDMFILASFSLNKNGYTAAGISAGRLMEKLIAVEEIDACGFNCGVGSGHMLQLLKKVSFPADKWSYAAPNAGYPEQMQNRMVFMDNEVYFAENLKKIAGLGIDMIGGCCGTTPEYIRRMAENIGTLKSPTVRSDRDVIVTGGERSEENEFYRLLNGGKKVIAVELDPPYDANVDHIMECAHSLKSNGADIITFADSPMGRSRVDSILMSIRIAEETGMKVMPHVCCRDRNMISMRATLLGAYIHGIRNLLIVTGDPVPGESRVSTTGVFDYNSIRLMEYVKEMNVEHFPKEPICYGGALNYNRGSLEGVVKRMKQKIEAGALYFLTQPVFSTEDAERLREIKEQVDTKILCGIMPLVSYRNACFIKNEITGIHVPEEIVARYHPEMTREEAEIVGAEVANEIIDMTKDFADGYYFMLPFNRVSLMDKIKI
jgi:homocysteine S-methyltransferase